MAPLTEADLWFFPVRDFEVDEWHMAPVSGIEHRLIQEWKGPEEMVDELRKRFELVFVTEDAGDELRNFSHPENACYVFGKANYSPFMNLRTAGDHAIKLKTSKDKALLWPHQCMVTVLWHRGLRWR
jgi:hypothetical protein